MATTTQTVTTDDITGTEGATRHTFSIDGASYEIDLADESWDHFTAALGRYTDVARKTNATRSSAKSSRPGPDPKAVRAWAKEKGLDVPARGRVAASIIAAYEAAH